MTQNNTNFFFDTVVEAKITICNLYEMGHDNGHIMLAFNLRADLK